MNGPQERLEESCSMLPQNQKTVLMNDLKRNESVTIFHLRTQHVPLNSHLGRKGVTQDLSCPLCPCPDETMELHLFECLALADLRAEQLPLNPTIENAL